MEFAEFSRRMDMLRSGIVNAVAYLTAWKELSDRDVEMAKALNRYKGMFLPAISAFQIMALLEICKIFDEDSRTVSMRNLVKVAKERLGKEEKGLKFIEEQIDKHEDLLARLKNYRDKRIAHHDALVPEKMPIPYGEVKVLIEDIKLMYYKLRVSHDGQETSFDRIFSDTERHTKEVMKIMREREDSK